MRQNYLTKMLFTKSGEKRSRNRFIPLPNSFTLMRQSSMKSSTHSGQFSKRVLTIVRKIPPGYVSTYGDVASMAGRPQASRAVGNIMRTCSTLGVPCHRVVAANGQIGGYDVLAMKYQLLHNEGIIFQGKRIKDFKKVRWYCQK